MCILELLWIGRVGISPNVYAGISPNIKLHVGISSNDQNRNVRISPQDCNIYVGISPNRNVGKDLNLVKYRKMG